MSDAREQADRIVMDAVAGSFPAKQRDEIRSFWDPRPVLDALLAASQDDGSPLVLLAPEQVGECTGLSATWCPVHGDCTCWHKDALDMPSCPLHGTTSEHASARGGNPND